MTVKYLLLIYILLLNSSFKAYDVQDIFASVGNYAYEHPYKVAMFSLSVIIKLFVLSPVAIWTLEKKYFYITRLLRFLGADIEGYFFGLIYTFYLDHGKGLDEAKWNFPSEDDKKIKKKILTFIEFGGTLPTNFFIFLCKMNDSETICKILEHCHIDVKKKMQKSKAQIYHGTYGYGSAIHYACYHGNKDLVEKLLQRGAGINNKEYYDNRPLFFACHFNNDIRFLNYLCKKGAYMYYDFEKVNITEENFNEDCKFDLFISQLREEAERANRVEKFLLLIPFVINSKKEQPLLVPPGHMLLIETLIYNGIPKEIVGIILKKYHGVGVYELIDNIPWEKISVLKKEVDKNLGLTAFKSNLEQKIIKEADKKIDKFLIEYK